MKGASVYSRKTRGAIHESKTETLDVPQLDTRKTVKSSSLIQVCSEADKKITYKTVIKIIMTQVKKF